MREKNERAGEARKYCCPQGIFGNKAAGGKEQRETLCIEKKLDYTDLTTIARGGEGEVHIPKIQINNACLKRSINQNNSDQRQRQLQAKKLETVNNCRTLMGGNRRRRAFKPSSLRHSAKGRPKLRIQQIDPRPKQKTRLGAYGILWYTDSYHGKDKAHTQAISSSSTKQTSTNL